MVVCGICNEKQSKYKCPKCLTRYCTVQCYKNHKANSCTTEIKPKDAENTETQQPPEDTATQQQQPPVSEVDPAPAATTTSAVTAPTGQDMTVADSEDRVPPQHLEKLSHSEPIKDLLRNPHLQTLITDLDSSPEPNIMIQKAMQEPIFTEFVQECLQVVMPQKSEVQFQT